MISIVNIDTAPSTKHQAPSTGTKQSGNNHQNNKQPFVEMCGNQIKEKNDNSGKQTEKKVHKIIGSRDCNTI